MLRTLKSKISPFPLLLPIIWTEFLTVVLQKIRFYTLSAPWGNLLTHWVNLFSVLIQRSLELNISEQRSGARVQWYELVFWDQSKFLISTWPLVVSPGQVTDSVPQFPLCITSIRIVLSSQVVEGIKWVNLWKALGQCYTESTVLKYYITSFIPIDQNI